MCKFTNIECLWLYHPTVFAQRLVLRIMLEVGVFCIQQWISPTLIRKYGVRLPKFYLFIKIISIDWVNICIEFQSHIKQFWLYNWKKKEKKGIIGCVFVLFFISHFGPMLYLVATVERKFKFHFWENNITKFGWIFCRSQLKNLLICY